MTREMHRSLSVVVFIVICNLVVARKCAQSVTTASGSCVPSRICSGDLIFEENFDEFNLKKWRHAITLGGGGNWEFQWYTNNRTNSFVQNGALYIKPTLTADHLGYDEIYRNTLDLNDGPDACTHAAWSGCSRTGTDKHVLNPIKSARIETSKSFRFKYGKLKVRAKMPTGDWIWPAIWMLPSENVYGGWPKSGEIDIVEGRGNRDLTLNGKNIGTQMMGSTLHWGSDGARNGYQKTHWEKTNYAGFNSDFHVYEIHWTPRDINFYVDGEHVGGVAPPSGGFWELGGWGNSVENPWQNRGIIAPFDQEFYIIINNAVGGISYFPDAASNANGKPWKNNSPRAASDFWENRHMWEHTWNLRQNDDAALQVDYVRVYAL